MSVAANHQDANDLLPLPAADLQVLLLLAAGPLHPYGISKAVEENPGLGVRLEAVLEAAREQRFLPQGRSN